MYASKAILARVPIPKFGKTFSSKKDLTFHYRSGPMKTKTYNVAKGKQLLFRGFAIKGTNLETNQ